MHKSLSRQRWQPAGARFLSILFILVLLVSSAGAAYAQDTGPGGFDAQPLAADDSVVLEKIQRLQPLLPPSGQVSVIVRLADEPLASYDGGLPGLAATSPRATGQKKVNPKSNASRAYLKYLERQQKDFKTAAARSLDKAAVTRSYTLAFNGVALSVPVEQVPALFRLPGVQDVYIDQLLQLDTDSSPAFIGATSAWAQLGGVESAGEGVIVGVLDSGVWPEHPSFADPDPSGKPYAPPPPAPSGTARACQFAVGANPGDPFACNNKLIGAYVFLDTYQAAAGLSPLEFTSARDDNGHGTHTASTAAGNSGVMAEILGAPAGVISGIAPRAHLIAYRVCGSLGCYSSDSAAAVEQAILDGVDVINFSISGGNNPYSDMVELAFLGAYEAGIFVAASGGNTGPGADTVNHRGPWVTTVAASTQRRTFTATASLTADGGAALSVSGASIMGGVGPAELTVYAPDVMCNSPLPAGSVDGKIVLCQRGVTARVAKGYNVLQGGAVGMILYNQSAAVTDLSTDTHFLPAVQVQYSDGQALLDFLAANSGVMATLSGSQQAEAQPDVIASFSARGGAGQTLGVSKPDITAPGVQILAGQTPYLADGGAPQGQLFQALAGTSMSSPHIAGSAALLVDMHPTWTPGQIKSALMTTAWTQVVKEDGVTPATSFDTGSGRVDLSKAGDPGITFDVSAADYWNHRDDLWNTNYPSIYIPSLPGKMTVQRTVRSVQDKTALWKVQVVGASANDFKISVTSQLNLKAGATGALTINIDASRVPLGETRFATILLSEQTRASGRQARIPVTFVRRDPVVALNIACDPAVITRKASTTCAITTENQGTVAADVKIINSLPKELRLNPKSVSGASIAGNTLTFTGTLAPRQPASFTVAPGSSPAGYLPLSLFGIAPISGAGDESIHNYSVPAFQYGSETYTRIAMVSNGYAIAGGGTAADVQFLNSYLPSASRPNNVIAPFWTDLNPAFGGALRVASLSDGVNSWIVLDWENVREYSTARTYSFQVWVRTGAVEEVFLTYGLMEGDGEGGMATVGAENAAGTGGATFYYNGSGVLPYNGLALQVLPVPGAPGETHTITYSAAGFQTGTYTNAAQLTSNVFPGTSVKIFTGKVTAK